MRTVQLRTEATFGLLLVDLFVLWFASGGLLEAEAPARFRLASGALAALAVLFAGRARGSLPLSVAVVDAVSCGALPLGRSNNEHHDDHSGYENRDPQHKQDPNDQEFRWAQSQHASHAGSLPRAEVDGSRIYDWHKERGGEVRTRHLRHPPRSP